MKWKYYLRGLGIGILVTTVILSLAGIGRKNMTDEEVIKRAKELGMVESTLLSDLADQEKADEVKPTEPETSPQPEETLPPETEPETTPEDGSSDTPAGETFTLVIGRGESSTTVSKNLKRAGIVEDAAAFDKFLCNNGYDKKIITGTYEIPYGASEEEIAKIITRK